MKVPQRERDRHKSSAEPVYTPTMAGGLFSINKAFFQKLGTYDSGFDIWGGENLELSFKVSKLNFVPLKEAVCIHCCCPITDIGKWTGLQKIVGQSRAEKSVHRCVTRC